MTEAEEGVLRAFEGTMIVFSGMLMLTISGADALCQALFNANSKAKPELFETFFKSALFFDDVASKNLVFRYLIAADTFGFEPGLGATEGGKRNTANADFGLARELAKAGIGNGARPTFRLADYLKQYRTPLAAKSALTPAKRDALKMEARKLLSVPASAFKPYFQGRRTASGVRG